jgi:hypothetical protein
MIGYRSKICFNPRALKIISVVNPNQIPVKWGTVLLYPKLAPEAVTIILFGPGVILIENVKIIIGRI